MSGHQNGYVQLWDLRYRDGRALRIKFPAKVNNTRNLDQNRIVVTGQAQGVRNFSDSEVLPSQNPKYSNNVHQISLYDLRSLPAPDVNRNDSTPYMTFPTYTDYNLSTMTGSFDVHGDLVAAVNRNREIQLFDAGIGKELLVREETSTAQLGQQPICVRFGEALDGRGLRLYVSAGTVVKELGWFDENEEELS